MKKAVKENNYGRKTGFSSLLVAILLVAMVALPVLISRIKAIQSASMQASLRIYADSVYALPAAALDQGGNQISRGLLTSVSPNQTMTASYGQTVSLAVSYQIWQGSNPSEIDQLFFIYSWTPSWPPPSGYYAGIFDSIPSGYPGGTGTTQISVQVPVTTGIYYLWLGFCAHYSVSQAVAEFKTALSLPAHVEILVGPG